MIVRAFFVAAAVCAIVVAILRWYALRRNVIDYPNDRSSHTRPTPRGGGAGIVLTAVGFLALHSGASIVRWAMVACILSVAIVGWIDDHRSLPTLPRLLVHILAGVGMGWIAIQLEALALPLRVPTLAFMWWTLWTVATINVTNFMDGIDALIGLQLLVFGLFALVNVDDAGGVFARSMSAVAAGAAIGFLIFNWPPARIFMGDVGSGAIGVVFVLLGLLTIRSRGWTVVHAYLPLLPLFADEVVTMTRRIRDGESITTAHRSHVYQRAVQAYPGHAKVSVAYAAAAMACGAWPMMAPRWNTVFVAGTGTLIAAILSMLIWTRSSAEARLSGQG